MRSIHQHPKTVKWLASVLTIFAFMCTETTNAQTAVFGSFGTQADTVSALYNNSGSLYIGAKTPVALDRMKVYDGANLLAIGYSAPQTGTEITAIGRIAGDSIVVFDFNSANSTTRMQRYNGSGWTYNSNPWTGTSWSGGVFGSTNKNNSLTGTTFYANGQARLYDNTGGTTPWNNTLSLTTVYDLSTDPSGINMYASGYHFNQGMRIWQAVNATMWTQLSINVPSSLYFVTEVESFNEDLYFVARATQSGIGELFRWNASMGSTPESLGTGQYIDLEFHDGKLYVAGDALRSFDGTTWTTLATLVTGQIAVMESYGTKLALGGSFQDLGGNTALDNLAYLEYITAPTAMFNLSTSSVCVGSSITLTDASTGTVDSYTWDIQGGTPSSSNLADPGSVSFSNTGTYTITLTVTNADGSSSYQEDVTIHANPVPVISADGSLTFCSGGSVELSTDQYVDYSWSNGPVTQNNLVSTAGTYSVTVTNANGCVGTSTGVTVVVNPNPTPVITPVGNDLTSNYTMGNQWAVDLSLIPGLQTITPTVNGTYTVTVTDANGCVGTSAGFVVDDLGMDEAELLQHVSISNGQLTTDLEWVLYDASGREISKGKPGTYDLPSGVFFLVTELGNLRFYNQ